MVFWSVPCFLRKEITVPIVMLTAKGEEVDNPYAQVFRELLALMAEYPKTTTRGNHSMLPSIQFVVYGKVPVHSEYELESASGYGLGKLVPPTPLPPALHETNLQRLAQLLLS